MTPLPIPVLESPRLILRGHRLEDFSDSLAMWRDPEVCRHITGEPSTEEEVWARLMRYVGHWALLGFGYWAVRERATGRFVGEVGLADFRRALEPPFGDAPESGWALARWAHGRGFATEAVQAALRWADEQLGVPRTVCMIAPANGGSIRVAEKCGFRRYGETTYKGEASLLFERTTSRAGA